MASEIGVSIIIDSYNHEKFVASTIESNLAQDHHPVQVIVIDDGSPDRSQEIIRSFGDRITTIFQENQGQVAAVKRALPLAKYDIVMIVDSDDLLDPNAVSSVVSVWREGVSKVQYSLRVIDENGTFNGNYFPKYSSLMTPEMVRAEVLRTGSYPDSPTSGNAYDRRFLEIALPLAKQRNAFDGELNGVAPLYGDVITISEPLGCYRIHGSNDYSINRIDVDKFVGYLRHRERTVGFVKKHYKAKGQAIEDNVLDNDLKYLEYRLVVEKLGQAEGKTAKDLWQVVKLGMRAAWKSPFLLIPKLLRMAWIPIIGLMPKVLARPLIEQRFVPARRWPWITWLAKLRSGGSNTDADGSVQVFGRS